MLRTRVTKSKSQRIRDKKTKERLWQLESGITYSGLSSWLDNPEAFYLNYCEGLTPKRFRKPIEFGNIIHFMLEHQFTGRKKSPVKVANEIATGYENVRSKTTLSTDREQLHLLCQVAKMLFPIYCDYWKEEDAGIEWLAREQSFKTPYEFIDLEGKKRTILLRGMRDGLFRNDYGTGVFETKTKENIDTAGVAAQLKADMQTLFYLFTSRIDLKKQPNQILYNIIRRPGQRNKNETVDQFVKRIQQDVLKREKHYFMRWEVDVETKDYDKFEQQTLLPILRLFVRWADSLKKNRWDSPYHLTNLNALIGKFGPSEYWDLIINGRQSMYYRRSSTFPELEESIL
jgi:hypothetical protein